MIGYHSGRDFFVKLIPKNSAYSALFKAFIVKSLVSRLPNKAVRPAVNCRLKVRSGSLNLTATADGII
jgi:hypothetical protein